MKPIKEKKKLKTYNFTGYINYSHCFEFEIEAENKKEAKRLAEKEVDNHINPSMAEYSSYKLDESEII